MDLNQVFFKLFIDKFLLWTFRFIHSFPIIQFGFVSLFLLFLVNFWIIPKLSITFLRFAIYLAKFNLKAFSILINSVFSLFQIVITIIIFLNCRESAIKQFYFLILICLFNFGFKMKKFIKLLLKFMFYFKFLYLQAIFYSYFLSLIL